MTYILTVVSDFTLVHGYNRGISTKAKLLDITGMNGKLNSKTSSSARVTKNYLTMSGSRITATQKDSDRRRHWPSGSYTIANSGDT